MFLFYLLISLTDNSNFDFYIAVKRFMLSDIDFSNNFVFIWPKWIPKKCNILVWRAAMGRIPTVDALARRNCYNGDDTCVLCSDGPESADHLFCACYTAAVLWNQLSIWCRVRPIFAFSTKDLLELHESSGLVSHAKEIFHGLIVVGYWVLWKKRNDIRFLSASLEVGNLIQEVKVLGFFGKDLFRGIGGVLLTLCNMFSPLL
ncbi:putative reverse transcriptase zinc-binding domain-containing protein [Helianthus annuus]|nr:putative reverse transcriptase zinc-binding domain-containing protein [Helianthus annuus]